MATPAAGELELQLEEHRAELTAYCYRMLASPFEAEDAVQETMIRAWRGLSRFEGRAALRSWLYRIATNVCLDMLKGVSAARARWISAFERAGRGEPEHPAGSDLGRADPDGSRPSGDPAAVTEARETIRLAFVAALQHLPPRQRAVLILCEVLRWKASEVAELLETSVASVNSALQRARATLEESDVSPTETPASVDEVEADCSPGTSVRSRTTTWTLRSLIREDATQSMPPYDMWLRGREDIFAWWWGPGIGCEAPASSRRCRPTARPPSAAAPSPDGGHEPWALQVLEIEGGGIAELTFFLDTDTLFPLFGLPPRLDSLKLGPRGAAVV